jgi:hypothetical protein
LHYELLSARSPARRDLRLVRIPPLGNRAITSARVRTGVISPTGVRPAPLAPARALVRTAGAGQPDIGCAAVAALTVPAHWPIADHAAGFEHDATDRFDLAPQQAQDRVFVAACLPFGIGPDHHGGAER